MVTPIRMRELTIDELKGMTVYEREKEIECGHDVHQYIGSIVYPVKKILNTYPISGDLRRKQVQKNKTLRFYHNKRKENKE